jgi:hypothetical protein
MYTTRKWKVVPCDQNAGLVESFLGRDTWAVYDSVEGLRYLCPTEADAWDYVRKQQQIYGDDEAPSTPINHGLAAPAALPDASIGLDFKK